MPRILAADIGGTHSRFGFFAVGPGDPGLLRRLGPVVRLGTGEAPSFAALLGRLFAAPRPFAPAECDLAVFAAPGPVRGGTCRLTNVSWNIDLADLAAAGLGRGALLNDFAAQAYACRSPAAAGLVVIQPGRRPFASGGVVAVLGAGTGLGCCALVTDAAGGLLAVPSEGGHAAFPFSGALEQACGEHLRHAAGLPYCEVETVVSGPGLARLHEYVTGEALSPEEAEARLAHSPATEELFARFYGRAARNYALTLLALGGICISGGLAGRNPLLLRHPAFLAEFLNASSPGHADLLAGIPVVLNRDDDFGVSGAAFYGALLLAHG